MEGEKINFIAKNISIAQKIAEFSSCFKEAIKNWLFYFGLPDELSKIRDDPLLAIYLFAGMAHERAGRNPNFPKFHRIALKRALNGKKFEDILLNDPEYPNKVWSDFEKLTNGKSNRSHTVGAVKEILEKMREEKEPNVIDFLGEKHIEDARECLCSLGGIGPKLSAYIMRDFHDFFSLWKDELKLNKEKYSYLQPVDRWVERISEIVWSIKLEGDHDKKAKTITEHCSRENIDPITFNQGAWFLSAKLNELCAFQRIPEEKRELDNIAELIERFNPKKIKRAMHEAFVDLKNEKAILIW